MPKALILIPEGFEEMETVAPIDLLRRADVEVTVATTEENLLIKGRSGISLQADVHFKEIVDKDFDLVVLPGGPGHTRLLDQDRVLDWLRKQNEAGKWIASICAGPIVLNAAGVIDGRAFTSHHSTSGKLPGRDPDAPVVESGRLITSQGAGTATRFALRLVAALCGEDKAKEIAASIAFEL